MSFELLPAGKASLQKHPFKNKKASLVVRFFYASLGCEFS